MSCSTVRCAARLVDVNERRNLLFSPPRANRLHMGKEAENIFAGDIEVDKSYFAAGKGDRGRGAAEKVHIWFAVAGFYEDHCRCIFKTCRRSWDANCSDGIVYLVAGLAITRLMWCVPTCHQPFGLFADKQNHINGIENFGTGKRHMREFNGVPKSILDYF